MSVVLIGYRGTGKTATAEQLATRLGCPWCDADREIERRAGQPIAAIFAEQGETAFRDLEEEVVAALLAGPPQVVALGGGAVLREATRRRLVGHAVVWLTASPETIYRRVTADPTSAAMRPALTAAGGMEEIRQLLAVREPIYRQCAALVVPTEEKSVAEVAAEIAAALSALSPPTHSDPPAADARAE